VYDLSTAHGGTDDNTLWFLACFPCAPVANMKLREWFSGLIIM